MANGDVKALSRGAAASLLTFGGTIGVMTALSDAKGTVTTLFGLLFALIGGSLVSIFKGDGLTAPQRNGMFHSAGWLSAGVLVGLVIGFSAIIAEAKWFPAPVTVKGRELAATKERVEAPARRTATDSPRRLVLHSEETEKMTALRKALRAQLQDPSISAEQKATLRHLGELLEDPVFTQTVGEAADLIQSSSNLQDTFTGQFKSAFGQSLPRQK